MGHYDDCYEAEEGIRIAEEHKRLSMAIKSKDPKTVGVKVASALEHLEDLLKGKPSLTRDQWYSMDRAISFLEEVLTPPKKPKK